jgi:hypothetical protein
MAGSVPANKQASGGIHRTLASGWPSNRSPNSRYSPGTSKLLFRPRRLSLAGCWPRIHARSERIRIKAVVARIPAAARVLTISETAHGVIESEPTWSRGGGLGRLRLLRLPYALEHRPAGCPGSLQPGGERAHRGRARFGHRQGIDHCLGLRPLALVPRVIHITG